MSVSSDITIENAGVFVFRTHTEAAAEWVGRNVQVEDWSRLGADAFVVDDRRLALDIAQGAYDAGLVVT